MKLKIQTLGLRKYTLLWEHNASHTVEEPKNDADSTVCTLGIENCVHVLSLSTIMQPYRLAV